MDFSHDQATSFGNVAESYDRVRPGPPPAALDWLVPDASADAVFVSTAWHWLDPARAVPEIARVLRPGGRLGVIWTSRDRDQDWVAELDLLRLGDRADGDIGEVRAKLERDHSVTLPGGSAFGGPQTASFRFMRTVSVDDVIDWLATSSAFITATEGDRAAGLARCRAAVAARAGGSATVEMPMRSWCWRARRSDVSPAAD